MRNLLLAAVISGSQAGGVLAALLLTAGRHGLEPAMIAVFTGAAAVAGLLVAAGILARAPGRPTRQRGPVP